MIYLVDTMQFENKDEEELFKKEFKIELQKLNINKYRFYHAKIFLKKRPKRNGYYCV